MPLSSWWGVMHSSSPKRLRRFRGRCGVGAGEKFQILDLIQDFSKTNTPCIHHSEIQSVNTFISSYSAGDRTRTFLKIQDGCDYKCSFCTIPLARGKSRSDSLENVQAQVRSLAQKGVKEIVLTGVNLGDYGKDQPHTFLDVIQAWIRKPGLSAFVFLP